jgi:hypothetical protein
LGKLVVAMADLNERLLRLRKTLGKKWEVLRNLEWTKNLPQYRLLTLLPAPRWTQNGIGGNDFIR